MPKALILLAHPNPHSYNGLLFQGSQRSLAESGWEVATSDLYRMQFQPTVGPTDFQTVAQPQYFDLQAEQEHALKAGTFAEDILQEQKKLREADLLIFHFPFWWYSMPAILKGYIDRVFTVGFAYGGGFALAEKKALACITTGAGEDWLNDQTPAGSIQTILHHLLYGTFAFCQMQVLSPYIVYRAKKHPTEKRLQTVKDWEEKLRQLDPWPLLFEGGR